MKSVKILFAVLSILNSTGLMLQFDLFAELSLCTINEVLFCFSVLREIARLLFAFAVYRYLVMMSNPEQVKLHQWTLMAFATLKTATAISALVSPAWIDDVPMIGEICYLGENLLLLRICLCMVHIRDVMSSIPGILGVYGLYALSPVLLIAKSLRSVDFMLPIISDAHAIALMVSSAYLAVWLFVSERSAEFGGSGRISPSDVLVQCWWRMLDFTGRMSRRDYACFVGIISVLIVSVVVLNALCFTGSLLIVVCIFVIGMPFVSATTRRIRSVGLGWWGLPIALCSVGTLILVLCLLKDDRTTIISSVSEVGPSPT